MLRKLLMLFISFLFLFVITTWAEESSFYRTLLPRLQKTTDKYQTKVGLTFVDLKSGEEIEINGNQEFPTASVIKLAVMACAYHLAEIGEIDLQQKLLFKESDKVGGAGVLQWMKAGKLYTIWNLIRLMIVLSDNTATKILVNYLTQEKINNYLRELGFTKSKVVDPTMLKEPPDSNINISTPLEMARLMANIANSKGFNADSQKTMLTWLKNQRYRWGIPRGLPPRTIVANKTGHLEGVLNDVGVVYTKKGSYVLSIFTYGIPKKREAKNLINQISRIVYEEYTGEKVPETITKAKMGRKIFHKAKKNSKNYFRVKKKLKIKKPTKKQLWRRPFLKYPPR